MAKWQYRKDVIYSLARFRQDACDDSMMRFPSSLTIHQPRATLVFAMAIFLSAFLVFQVQPVIARYILPWYGGSPSVWTVCLLFFQAGLLGGYAYAHALVSALRERLGWQVAIHLGLLAAAMLLLPVTPDDSLKPQGNEASPATAIIRLLVVTVGAPYLLLSASGPLLQHWFGAACPGRSPYRLYAVSNVGSMLGLLTYPFLFEPLLAVSRQTQLWSGAFVVYALFAAACAWLMMQNRRAGADGENAGAEAERRPPFGVGLLWVALAATASTLLLAITNQLCQDVSVVPFLWVLPLSLYLLTFVIAFDHQRWYRRSVAIPMAGVAIALVIWQLDSAWRHEETHIVWQVAIFLAAIFTTCFVCHGELARSKPEPRYLTGFYLAIAFGGALGGLFVSLLAPVVFDGYWEFHLALLVFILLVLLLLVPVVMRLRWRMVKLAAGIAGAGVFSVATMALWGNLRATGENAIETRRSFYGVHRVYDWKEIGMNTQRVLYHGRILHGMQFTAPHLNWRPTTYYMSGSGIQRAFDFKNEREMLIRESLDIGVVGLGAGTIAALAKLGDRMVFYEIDPDVVEIANAHFTYLSQSRAMMEVVLGDGRISLAEELREKGSRQYDLLVFDAFSSDSIPIHLLTREAFELYFAQLKPNGVLVINMTNRYVDISDPVRRIAARLGAHAWKVSNEATREGEYFSEWILVSRDESVGEYLLSKDALTPWPRAEAREVDWTDDYANLFHVVIWEGLNDPFQRAKAFARRLRERVD